MIYHKEALNVKMLHAYDFDNENIATILFLIEKNYLALGLIEEFIKCFQQSLIIRQNILCDNEMTVSQTLQKLTKSYDFNRSNNKAILCYLEAIRFQRKCWFIE